MLQEDLRTNYFLYVNFSVEMMYILTQRLKAQNISDEKSKKVLNDIVATTFKQATMDELLKTGLHYSPAELLKIFERLAHSSIMRLNEQSMGKLYDLMKMAVKFQVLRCKQPEDLLKLTGLHLSNIVDLIEDPAAHATLERVYSHFQDYFFKMSRGDLWRVRQEILMFTLGMRVKVSLFLQSGDQKNDGYFKVKSEGTVPYKGEVPGTIRYYNPSGDAKTVVLKLPLTNLCSPYDENEPFTLGSDMYNKNKPASSQPVPLRAATETTPSATASSPAAAVSGNIEGSMSSILASRDEVLKSVGGKPFLFSMLCLVGEGRAGKSGLKNAMLGKSFASTDSTIGMSQEVLEVVKEHIEANQSCSWVQYDRKQHKEAEEAFARVLAKKYQNSLNSNNSNNDSDNNNANVDEEDFISGILSFDDNFCSDIVPEPHVVETSNNTNTIEATDDNNNNNDEDDDGDSSPPAAGLVTPSLPPSSSDLPPLPSNPAAAASSSRPPSPGLLGHDVADYPEPGTSRSPEDTPTPAPLPTTTTTTTNTTTASSSNQELAAFKLDEGLVMKFLKNPGEEPLKFTLWDFGGQEVFYTMHHLFLNRFGVYLVTFNMEWLVPRLAGGFVENGVLLTADQRMKRCLDMIHFWLKSILLHTHDTKDSSSAPVFLVGTHKDKVKDVSDHAQISKLLHENFADDFPNLHFFRNGEVPTGRGLLWFFPVDNVQGLADPVMRVMMQEIETVVRQEEYTKRKVPFEWLAVCDRLQEESRKSMRLSDFEALCRECGVRSGTSSGAPSSSSVMATTTRRLLRFEDEVQLVLRFYSNLGLIMYHSELPLRNLVVTNPVEFLITAVTKFICNEDIHPVPEHKDARKLTVSWKRLARYGVLDSVILDILWRDFKEYASELEYLMCKFGLVIPLVEDEAKSSSSQTGRQYLVPALLPASPANIVTEISPLTCYIVFAMSQAAQSWNDTGAVSSKRVTSEGFLPHGIFARLVGKAVAHSQLCSQELLDVTEMQLMSKSALMSFGDHAFKLMEMSRENVIRVDVFVDNTIVIVESLNALVQQVINECVPNLRALMAIPVGPEDPRTKGIPSHYLIIHGENGLQNRVIHGRVCPSGISQFMGQESLESKFSKWLPPSGLLEEYDVFLSYRWGAFDSEFAERLFFALSRENIKRSQTRVFLDKQRLRGGKNFVSEFMTAMLHTKVAVLLVSANAVERMISIAKAVERGEDKRDNVLVEWSLALQLHRLGKLRGIHPIMIGTMDADHNPASMKSLFTPLSNGMSLLDSLPDKTSPVVVKEVTQFLSQLGLKPTDDFPTTTIRQTVKAISDFLGTLCWNIQLSHGPTMTQAPNSMSVTKQMQEECTRQVMKILRSQVPASEEDEADYSQEKLKLSSKLLLLQQQEQQQMENLANNNPVNPNEEQARLDRERSIWERERALQMERDKLDLERQKMEAQMEAEKQKAELEKQKMELEKQKMQMEMALLAAKKSAAEVDHTKKKSGACTVL